MSRKHDGISGKYDGISRKYDNIRGKYNNTEDKRKMMEEMPIARLLWKMSGPSVIGVMAYNLYNVFDTVFVSHGAGTDAVGGVAVSFPLFIFLSAVSSTLGSGAASVISRALGERDNEKAAKAAANTFLMFYTTAVLITAFGLIWLDELLLFMGVTDTLLPYAKAYTRIILLGAVTSTGFSNLIRAEGNSRYAMYRVIGAAIGTVAGQGISMAMSIWFFYLSGKSVHHFRLRHFKPDLRLMWEVVGIGLPSSLQLSGQSVSMVIVNQFLKKYGGDLAISSYGIAYRIVVFVLFPIQGLAQGLQPVIGYNKGASCQRRVKRALFTASAAAGTYGVFAYISTLLFAEVFMKIFTSDTAVIETGVHILVIVNAAVLFSGIQSMQTTYFQAAGKKIRALIMALCGQLLCFVPCVLIMSRLFGLEGVWFSFPGAALLSLVISSVLTAIQLKYERN